MRTLRNDLRFALRTYRKSPVFSISAIVLIALGVGLNAAMFSLFDGIVLRSLPAVSRPAELVDVGTGGNTYPSYQFLRDGSGREIDGMAAWANRWLSLAVPGTAERVRGTVVSANYFHVLGVTPGLGRFFVPREETSGEPVAVLSHDMWIKKFGGDASAIGRVVRLNGMPYTVVGVAPARFRGVEFATQADLWIPIGAWPRLATGNFDRLDYRTRNWGWLSMFGRLRSGVDISRARAAFTSLRKREAAAFPTDAQTSSPLVLAPLARSAAGAASSADPIRLFGLLLAAVGVVLLIACANLANLLLARAIGRRREIAVRQAIGATRGRIVRQLLTESVLLGVCGGVAGILVAAWSLALLTHIPLPGGSTFDQFGVALDARVLAFALLISVATGVLFGLFPALQASKAAVLPAIKGEPGRASRRGLGKSSLVAAQLALCLLLLSCAGLFVRSLRNAMALDLGFQPSGVALASVHLGIARYDEPRARLFTAALAARAAELPGVQAVSWTGLLPLSGGQDEEFVAIEGAPEGKRDTVNTVVAGPGYFSTLGIPLVAGREFDRVRDLPSAAPAVVVNDAAARRFWPALNPVGKRLKVFGKLCTVVGVSRNARFFSLREMDAPLVVGNLDQIGDNGLLAPLTLAVRTTGDPRAVLAALRAESARLDPALPLFELRTLSDFLSDVLLPQRFGSVLLTLFSALSFVLALVGVYAVVAGSVGQRRREFAIRMALGARPEEVRRMILRQTAIPLAAGVAAGLPITLLATRAFRQFLYGVLPADAMTLALALVLLVAGGLAAAALPARRAARIHPMETLRNE